MKLSGLFHKKGVVIGIADAALTVVFLQLYNDFYLSEYFNKISFRQFANFGILFLTIPSLPAIAYFIRYLFEKTDDRPFANYTLAYAAGFLISGLILFLILVSGLSFNPFNQRAGDNADGLILMVIEPLFIAFSVMIRVTVALLSYIIRPLVYRPDKTV